MPVKSKTPKKKETSQLQKLAAVMSGEAEMEKKKKNLEKMKKDAIAKQRKALNEKIKGGALVIEEEDVLSDEEIELLSIKEKKIVQKMKLYEWESPIRVTFPFDSKSFLWIVVGALVFIMYLAILGQYGLMFAIASLLFFIYVAGTTEPPIAKHIITTQGIDTFDTLYEWFVLKNFWFTKKNNQYVMVIETKLRMPGSLTLLFKKEEMGALFMLLQDKLLYKEIKKTSTVHRYTYGEYIPIEKIEL